MRVKISELQLRLLRTSPETAEVLGDFLRDGDPPYLEGEGLPLQEFRELCSDILNRIGFDKDYDLTPEGVALEDLIDKLFVP